MGSDEPEIKTITDYYSTTFELEIHFTGIFAHIYVFILFFSKFQIFFSKLKFCKVSFSCVFEIPQATPDTSAS